MNYPDITKTTEYQNLQHTGYADGGLSAHQQRTLEELCEAEKTLSSIIYEQEEALEFLKTAKYLTYNAKDAVTDAYETRIDKQKERIAYLSSCVRCYVA